MQKRKLCWLGGGMLAVTTVLGLAFVITVKHEPNFYRLNYVPPSSERKEAATAFVRNFAQMLIYRKDRQPDWSCVASEAQLNSFFEEAFVQLPEYDSLRKLGISSPRVTVEGDHTRFAFRYGKGWFSTVISYDLKFWLVAKEPNVVAVQFLGARAGAIPISCQSILQQLSEYASKENLKVTMYRHEGTPVAVVNLQPDQPNPVSTLTVLRFNGTGLTIQGKTSEHALPPLEPKMRLVTVSTPP